ncbi:MAG TPA: VOC family protein [Ktedonobacterales bacterium]|nr:VOC family protein [Ktedonobacterales bacterium]
MSDHQIVHIEIPSASPSETSQFYVNVFDWPTQNNVEYDYITFQTGPQQGGGYTNVNATPPEGHPKRDINSVLVYISTDDINESLGKIEANGGKTLLPRTEIPGIGWWAVFADPAGNNLALYTALPRAEEAAPAAE